MDWIEDELKQSLRRRPAPAGFAEKVMTRAAVRPAGPLLSHNPEPLSHNVDRWRRWLAAAAVALIMAGGPFAYRRHEQQTAGREASRELLFALELTRAELEQASAKAFLLSTYEKGPGK